MGMFDHFEPDPPLAVDGKLLSGWQGKDGPCLLFVWRQHHSAPVDQAVDDEIRGLPEAVVSTGLPDGDLVIYTDHPSDRGLIYATITVLNGRWVKTKLSDEKENA